MLEVQLFPLLYLSTILLTLSTATSTATFTTAKRGCPTTCGNVTIPYPFGVIQDGVSCSLNRWYDINCTTSKPFWGPKNLEVMEISQHGQIRIKTKVGRKCYNNEAGIISNNPQHILSLNAANNSKFDYSKMPIVFSHTANKFHVLGCDDMGVVINGENALGVVSGCFATCSSFERLIKHNESCSGIGCCQSSISKGLTALTFQVNTISNHSRTTDGFTPCGVAFLGEEDKFTFNVDDLSDPSFVNRTRDGVPIVLEWVVGVGKTCVQAQQNMSSYACQYKTACSNIDIGLNGGYRCNCLPGYQGTPYLSPGCTDIDECANSSNNPCSDICTNTPGSFICSCPKGRGGDGLKTGSGCSRDHAQFIRALSLGVGIGGLCFLAIICWIFYTMRRTKLMKIREERFEKNGGLLLDQRLASNTYTIDQLKTATNNYSDNKIIGKADFGTVYKGILDDREVAIKKPNLDNQDESFQNNKFINEIAILMQTNHNNVVKLLGFCLEAKIPILVYEYISNRTLLKHIEERKPWLDWENCIRIATEVADALAYLHSKASSSMVHGNIKSANILLDIKKTAYIADFGTSTLVPTKLLRGTPGYMDPMYSQNGRLTKKSDVYSFGVVLAELLTKKVVRTTEEASLAEYFVSSVKNNCLVEILDPKFEASEEQLICVGELVMKCLDINSKHRPTMNDVAVELDKLKKKPEPFVGGSDEQGYDENETT